MTYAPDTLEALRTLLADHIAGLEPNEIGIVGDTNHQAKRSSYHLGKGQLTSDSYSVTESSRDRKGLTEAASAMDIGDGWSVTVNGKRHNLQTFSVWLVAQCKAGKSDTKDIREIIYSPDGEIVKRWDALGVRSTGDNTHTWHTHISWFRDSEKRDKTALFKRWLTEIGLLEDDVALSAEDWTRLTKLVEDSRPAPADFWNGVSYGRGETRRTVGQILVDARAAALAAGGRVDALDIQMDAYASADEARDAALPLQVRDALAAGQPPEQVAAALRQVAGVDWAAVGRILAPQG